jgi:hypothetical protein
MMAVEDLAAARMMLEGPEGAEKKKKDRDKERKSGKEKDKKAAAEDPG